MKSKEEYLEEIVTEIVTKKAEGKSFLFRIGAHIADNTAKYIKQQLEPQYVVDISKCVSCKQSWNIVVRLH